ncbi:hypothetical protein Bbelb_336720 [Branchiostoma belcheri]|nr:hypothetical protein Bbelb_336720 [Branchiostoma belcheri]
MASSREENFCDAGRCGRRRGASVCWRLRADPAEHGEVRSLPSGEYLASLCDDEAGRLTCVAHTKVTNRHRFVTGGSELLVWDQALPTEREVIAAHYEETFAGPVEHSEDESDEEEDGRDDIETGRRRRRSSAQLAQDASWCTVIQSGCVLLDGHVINSQSGCVLVHGHIFHSQSGCVLLDGHVINSQSECILLHSQVIHSQSGCILVDGHVIHSQSGVSE